MLEMVSWSRRVSIFFIYYFSYSMRYHAYLTILVTQTTGSGQLGSSSCSCEHPKMVTPEIHHTRGKETQLSDKGNEWPRPWNIIYHCPGRSIVPLGSCIQKYVSCGKLIQSSPKPGLQCHSVTRPVKEVTGSFVSVLIFCVVVVLGIQTNRVLSRCSFLAFFMSGYY